MKTISDSPLENLQLISYKLCPYVQRAIILLLEKEVTFTRTDIDLSSKPDWFKALSPTGKVPVLLVNHDCVLFESDVICHYIDETTPGNLLPRTPLLRAQHRSWIAFGSNILNQIGALYRAKQATDYQQAEQNLRRCFERLDAELVLPYFNGSDFQMVDAVYAPIFRYFDVFERRVKFNIFDGLEQIETWRHTLQQRTSVIQAVAPDYADALIDFVRKKNGYLATLFATASTPTPC